MFGDLIVESRESQSIAPPASPIWKSHESLNCTDGCNALTADSWLRCLKRAKTNDASGMGREAKWEMAVNRTSDVGFSHFGNIEGKWAAPFGHLSGTDTLKSDRDGVRVLAIEIKPTPNLELGWPLIHFASRQRFARRLFPLGPIDARKADVSHHISQHSR